MVKTQKKHTGTIVIIMFMAILAVLSIIFSYSYYRSLQNKILNIGEVSFSILPEDNGDYHQISMEFSLEGKSKALKNANKDTIKQTIVDVLSNEQYEKISGKGSTEYIKQKVKDNLKGIFKEGELDQIYITKFNDQISSPIDKQDSNTNKNSDKRDDIMKSLFPNMK